VRVVERAAGDWFGDRTTLAALSPLPDAGVIAAHETESKAVHEQPPVVICRLRVPPTAGSQSAAGVVDVVQAASVTVKTTPAIAIDAERDGAPAGLGWIDRSTEFGPLPEDGVVAIQAGRPLTLHGQPADVVIDTLTEPPAPGNDALFCESE
jgi:hypothetical protein